MKHFAFLPIVLVTSIGGVQQAGDTAAPDFLASLDAICVEDDGVFKNCDELFSKDGSSLFFIIIPKEGAKKWYTREVQGLKGAPYEKNDALAKKVQAIDKSTLSNKFDVWVFYVDKKYTKKVDMDEAYNLQIPRVTTLYHLESGRSNWQKVETFDVKTQADEPKEDAWRTAFIDKMINASNAKK